ncbi:hypothetical protein MMC12_006522 [Toensbergia leucococca]|nr:hypothetical protein [Toensbergia leucococca]
MKFISLILLLSAVFVLNPVACGRLPDPEIAARIASLNSRIVDPGCMALPHGCRGAIPIPLNAPIPEPWDRNGTHKNGTSGEHNATAVHATPLGASSLGSAAPVTQGVHTPAEVPPNAPHHREPSEKRFHA